MQRCRGRADARGIEAGPPPDVSFMLPVLLQGQRGLRGSRAARDRFGVMEEGEAEGGGPGPAREAPGQASHSQSTTTTTNLLASVKEQVPAAAAPLTPLIGLAVPAGPTRIW